MLICIIAEIEIKEVIPASKLAYVSIKPGNRMLSTVQHNHLLGKNKLACLIPASHHN